MNEEQGERQDSQNDLAVLSRPIVGDEHLNALGSAAQLSILRDLSLEAGHEGHVTADEAFQAAITYGRLAASIGTASEAIALATLLMGRADEAAHAGAIGATQAYLQEAALRYAQASGANPVALDRFNGVLAHPLYRAPTDDEIVQFQQIDALHRDAALGDKDALRAMASGAIMAIDTSGVRSVVAAEQFMRLAASDGTRLSAMGLVAVLFLRACWEEQPGGSVEHSAWAAAEAISIADAWAAEGDESARERCALMVQHLSPKTFALVAQIFPAALIYRDFEGVA